MGVLVAGAIMAGCGGSSGESRAAKAVSCTFVNDYCDALTAQLTAAEQAALQTSCGNAGGTAGTTCSTVDTISGHCQYDTAALAQMGFAFPGAAMNEYYYSAGWTLIAAQSYCAAAPAGVWVP
jgi:hypothetical protein